MPPKRLFNAVSLSKGEAIANKICISNLAAVGAVFENLIFQAVKLPLDSLFYNIHEECADLMDSRISEFNKT
jgi:hypothetical protein